MNKGWILLSLALAPTLAGCGQGVGDPNDQPGAPGAPPLAGARIGGPFALVDGDGRPRTDRDFAGRWRIMYFGYTYCPDVCPTDVATIGQAVRLHEARLGAADPKLVPVFVTVDPERDTPAVVKRFAAAFHPRMVGLTGSPAAIAAVEKAYGVYAKKGAASAAGGYLMDHSRTTYLMAPDGSPVAILPTDKGPAAVADELARWMRA